MARDRRGAQLCVSVPPDLLEQVRDEATRQGRWMGLLVCDWLRAGLAASQAQPVDDSEELALDARLTALEQAVQALISASSPRRVSSPPSYGGLPVRQQLELRDFDQFPITTAQLAIRTNTNRAGWNNWAAKAQPGDIREHRDAGNWRLIGKASADNGGPPRWLWEPA